MHMQLGCIEYIHMHMQLYSIVLTVYSSCTSEENIVVLIRGYITDSDLTREIQQLTYDSLLFIQLSSILS